ncbi:MAG: histidine kinase [Clostridium sp.]|jgi:two-component system sensor histidine kinase YesM|nr:histidine kinase [Clostridium sp.]
MSNTLQRLARSFRRLKIKKQLYFIYFLVIFIPILALGGFLIGTTYRLLMNYHRDLIESDNLRVKTIFFEITSQIYNISEEIAFDAPLTEILTGQYASREEYVNTYHTYQEMDRYINNYAEIDDISIYTDNPTVTDSKQLVRETAETVRKEWYRQALSQSSVLWSPIETVDNRGNHYWNLCLVRQIPLPGDALHAVLVIKISDNYLRSRLDTSDYQVFASLEDDVVFFSSRYDLYGRRQVVPIDHGQTYYQYTGPYTMALSSDTPTDISSPIPSDGHGEYLLSVSTLPLYRSASRISVCSLNGNAYPNIHAILFTCSLLLFFAILLPGILIHFFIRYFTGQVELLKDELHQASNADYEISEDFYGGNELMEASHDLQIMVQNITKKDAKIYEARIREENFKTEQQIMEFKMLAGQINPHFLYNTLETIRMKALTGGNREVADSIKLLGKSMRYVLENTGMVSVSLKKELDYVETYLRIQKLRFRDRINYALEIEEGFRPAEYSILPLLLQPVVENSILHGLEETEENGRISLKVATDRDEKLIIRVSDNGCGMTAEELDALNQKIRLRSQSRISNIGLYNISQRIRLCYGDAYGLQIRSDVGKGTTVSIVLPLQNLAD